MLPLVKFLLERTFLKACTSTWSRLCSKNLLLYLRSFVPFSEKIYSRSFENVPEIFESIGKGISFVSVWSGTLLCKHPGLPTSHRNPHSAKNFTVVLQQFIFLKVFSPYNCCLTFQKESRTFSSILLKAKWKNFHKKVGNIKT